MHVVDINHVSQSHLHCARAHDSNSGCSVARFQLNGDHSSTARRSSVRPYSVRHHLYVVRSCSIEECFTNVMTVLRRGSKRSRHGKTVTSANATPSLVVCRYRGAPSRHGGASEAARRHRGLLYRPSFGADPCWAAALFPSMRARLAHQQVAPAREKISVGTLYSKAHGETAEPKTCRAGSLT